MTWNANDFTQQQTTKNLAPRPQPYATPDAASALPSRLFTAGLADEMAVADLDTRYGAELCQAYGWWTPQETQQRRRHMTRGIIAWQEDPPRGQP